VKAAGMHKARLEAFSDGVIAIIITIMVLELKVPHDATLDGLRPLVPVFLSYVLSFVFVGIYWNNHHHMLQAAQHVNGGTLWANLHLLFWLSLIPFGTAWMGENHFEAAPVALYGFLLLMCGVAYTILSRALIRTHGPESVLAKAVGRDGKGLASLAIYGGAVLLAFFSPPLSCALYVVVAIMWLVPDQRIERNLARTPD
jgi:uncharacterized membrane protein